MPIGYIVNKRYVIDTLYDRYADLDVSKRIAREASKRGFGCHVYYSATARGYCCEIRKYENKFKHSAHIYFLTEGHKYGPNPLEAMCRAVRQCIPLDPLMRVLLLEAEAVQLGIEIKDRRAIENRLERALNDLFEVVALGWGYQTRNEFARETAVASATFTLDYINPDHLGAAFLGKPYPKPDLDDDL